MENSSAIVVMTRYPQPGFTKTRLRELLSHEQCAAFYWSCLEDLGTELGKLSRQVFVGVAGDGDWKRLRGLFPPGTRFFAQVGDRLGERMLHGFEQVFSEGFKPVVMVGGDAPELNAETLKDALEILLRFDCVIQPTIDGGFCLLGLNENHPELFSLSNYSHSQVYEQTQSLLNRAGVHWKALPVGYDVDTAEDLRSYYRRLQDVPKLRNTQTGKFVWRIFTNEGSQR